MKRKALKAAKNVLPPQAQLVLRGAKVARWAGRTLRKRWGWFAVLVAGAALLVGAALDTGHASIPPTPREEADRLGVDPIVWAAYQHTARLWCHPESGEVWLAPAEGNPVGRSADTGWYQVDWRLVAAVGETESHHAVGREVNDFGDVRPWVVGPALDGSDPALAIIADTDKGRWDLDLAGDRAVGPMQILPETMVQLGVDANRDGMADPHNVWDAAATAGRYLCVAGAGDVGRAVFAYNHSSAYVDDVTAVYLALVQSANLDDAVVLPDGLPLGHPAPHPESPLAGAHPMMASVVERWAAMTGFSSHIVPQCTDNNCAWVIDQPPEALSLWEEALAGIGAQGPVTAPGKVLFAGDVTRWERFPTLSPGVELSWPIHTTGPPEAISPSLSGAVPATTSTPQWWSFHLPSSDPAWSTPATVVLPTVRGAAVGSPTAGAASITETGCATIADDAGWLWRLCGFDDAALASGQVRAGAFLGTAANGDVTIDLATPEGEPACAGAVFSHWAQGALLSPQQIDDSYTDEGQDDEPGDDGQDGQSDESGDDEPEPNPIREC